MEKLKNIKAVIFDMDGVLLDSETICDYAWKRVAKENNLPDVEKLLETCRGTSTADSTIIINKMYEGLMDGKTFLDKCREYFFEVERKKGLALMPGVIEALEYLKTKYRLALATSTRQEHAGRQLKQAGIFDYFETHTYGDMVVHSKPEPEIYQIACRSLGLEPSECVAIEDSPNGIRSAVNASMTAVMIPDKIAPDAEMEQKAFAILKSLSEITKIL